MTAVHPAELERPPCVCHECGSEVSEFDLFWRDGEGHVRCIPCRDRSWMEFFPKGKVERPENRHE